MAKKKLNKFSNVVIENFWSIWFLVVVSLFLVFVAKQDILANYVWQKYRLANAALALDRSDADLAIQIGNYYFNGVIGGHEYDVGIAEKAFEKAVSINPKILWGHYQLARVYFVKGDFYKALGEINNELKNNPNNLRSLYVRGLIFGYQGNLSSAESDFKNFINWSPQEWAGYNDLAWILEKEGKYKEARETLQSAFKKVSAADKNPWLWNSLGVAKLNLKEYKSAKKAFLKSEILAKNLNENDWRDAYPGNDFSEAKSGLAAFLGAIDENIKRADLLGVDNKSL